MAAHSASRPWPVLEEYRIKASGSMDNVRQMAARADSWRGPRQFVRLGGHGNDLHLMGGIPGSERIFLLGGRTAYVQDPHHARQRGTAREIGFDHPGESRPHFFGNPGIAVPWKIHEHQGFIDIKKIDLPGTPGRGTGFDQLFAADQGIDER